ncbi:hypothetical protein Rhopal_000417-T1 [Rhodotorula paludigena]|uniref:MRH domain-containing protein n=1 Tax=Rhodotorula paludigena TaxID=86838 RepID=A0AAV5GAX5_9BASI|nr:hypothetical protein Rhopal_000417-T1 [Rhodotorula paludigena]
MVSSLRLAGTLAALASSALAASSKCRISGASIGTFDIAGLRRAKSDYTATNPDGGAISINFCGTVSPDASPAEAAQGYGAYIEDSRGGISLGEYSYSPSYHNGQLSLTYKNGASCPNSNAKRSSLIYLQCDKSWTSSNEVTLIDSLDDCTYFFTIKTPYACATSGGFFSAIWGALVFLFWLAVVIGGAFFLYTRFFGNKGGRTLGGNDSGGVGGAVSFVKDMVVVAGIWVIDTAQNVFQAVSRRRQQRSAAAQQYNYNYQPAPSHPHAGPDYSSEAWKAPSASAAASSRASPPAVPSKPQREREAHNPLAGGGSLLEDDEDDDEDALAMPGTKGVNGKGDNLV